MSNQTQENSPDSRPTASNRPETGEFSPLAVFERALTGWWLIVAAILVGGLTGLIIHTLKPPLYDATAVMTGSINFTETGELPEFQLDYALDSLGGIIRSATVHDEVLAKAQAAGLDLGSYGYQPYLERKASRWILRVRHPNPQTAAALANLWITTAKEHLDDAFVHALRAHQLNTYLTSLESCLSRDQVQEIAGVSCSLQDQASLQAAMAETTVELNNELSASQSLPASLVYALESTAGVPTQPTRYGLNSMVLAGGLIGLLIGVWAIQTNLAGSLARLIHHA